MKTKRLTMRNEKIIYEIYTKAISKLLDKNKDLLLTNKNSSEYT